MSYISKINKIKKEIKNLLSKIIKGLKMYFDKEKNEIRYKDYYLNEIPSPIDIKFKDIYTNSFKLFWSMGHPMLFFFKFSHIIRN